jgi:predicted nucleic acid-binding protein
MKYLLDVNALVALGFMDHEFHRRVTDWLRKLAADIPEHGLATCSITELGFVRVLAQATQYGFSISQGCRLLRRLKKAGTILKFSFLSDDHDISHIPAWVTTAKQTTDGHLAKLAQAKGAILATLDEGIPGSFIIPAGK